MTPLIALPACANTAALPDLPVLSAMLRGATRLPAAADWHGGVLAALGLDDVAGVAPVRVAACAIASLPQGTGVCLALPVHAVAGLSRMFLATAESFVLPAAQREALRSAFNAEFGAADLQLHAVGNGWVLQAPFAAAASDASVESLLGAALEREPAATVAGRSLRRLGAEVEMWLAGQPLNRDRETHGLPPINCFWFWGGAAVIPLPPPGPMHGSLFSNVEPDAWLAGLASHCGLAVQCAQAWDEVRDGPAVRVILQPALLGGAVQQLQEWEAGWLAPVGRDLAARRLAALRLQIGCSTWQLPAPRMMRWLRRRRPWWQQVCA